MKKKCKTKFLVKTVDGKVAKCREADFVRYKDTRISGGFVKGLPPDKYYLRFDRDGDDPTTIFLRRDELEAVLIVLSGTLWTKSLFKLDKKRKKK